MLRKLLRVFLASLFIAFSLGIAFNSQAKAVPLPVTTCSITPNAYYVTKRPSIETKSAFLARAEKTHPNANQKLLCTPVWNDAYQNFQATGSVADANAFDARFSACTNGASVANIPKNIGCAIKVSAIPSSTVLKSTVNDMTTYLNTHIPSNYILEVIHFIGQLQKTLKNGLKCDDSTGIGGASQWKFIDHVGATNYTTANLNITIPCKPDPTLQKLRPYLLIFVLFMYMAVLRSAYNRMTDQLALARSGG